MSDQDLDIRQYKPGEVIFAEGDMGEEAYIVERGVVEIAKGKEGAEMVLSIIKRGEMFGEMALIDSSPRMATARAAAKTTIIVIPQHAFQKLLGRTDVLVRTMLNTLIQRLRSSGNQTVKSVL